MPIKLWTMQGEVEHWKGALQAEKDKARQVWRRNCQQLTELEGLLTDKEAEVATLKQELERLQTSTSNVSRDMIRPTDEPSLQHPGFQEVLLLQPVAVGALPWSGVYSYLPRSRWD